MLGGAGAGASVAQDLLRRTALVDEGEARLAAGDTAAAQQAFDQAALIVHAADVELGLVRTYMQAGEYRRAVTFGSHAASAHPEYPAGMALYAWLLHIGGQGKVALRTLEDAIARAPLDPALQQARAALAAPWPRPTALLLARPLRLAPYDASLQVAEGAQVVGSGVLLGDSGTALVPAATLNPARRVWLRNGLGQTTRAVLVQAQGDGLALLRLDRALGAAPAVAITPTTPFAGSPSYLAEFGASDPADPAWPVLRQGFFGRYSDAQALRPLGIAAPRGPRGGPVFDGYGRLAGVSIAAGDGTDRLVPVSRFAHLYTSATPSSASPAYTAPVAAEALYESALKMTLQVIVEP